MATILKSSLPRPPVTVSTPRSRGDGVSTAATFDGVVAGAISDGVSTFVSREEAASYVCSLADGVSFRSAVNGDASRAIQEDGVFTNLTVDEVVGAGLETSSGKTNDVVSATTLDGDFRADVTSCADEVIDALATGKLGVEGSSSQGEGICTILTTDCDAVGSTTDGEGVITSTQSDIELLGNSSVDGDRVSTGTHANGTRGDCSVDSQGVVSGEAVNFDGLACSTLIAESIGCRGTNKSDVVGSVCSGVSQGLCKEKGYRWILWADVLRRK